MGSFDRFVSVRRGGREFAELRRGGRVVWSADGGHTTLQGRKVRAVVLEAVDVADCALVDMALWRLGDGGQGYVGVELGGVGVVVAGGAPALMEAGVWSWGAMGGRLELAEGTVLEEGAVGVGDVVALSVVCDGWEVNPGKVAEVELPFVPPVGVELWAMNYERYQDTGNLGNMYPKKAKTGVCTVSVGGLELEVGTAWTTNVLSKAFSLGLDAQQVAELWADGGSRAVRYAVSGLKGVVYKDGCGVRARGAAVSRVVQLCVVGVELEEDVVEEV